jgi:PAS domain S-box-containing protein
MTLHEPNLMVEDSGKQDTAIGQEAHDRFLALSSEMQMITGSDGCFQWVSPTVAAVLGWTIEEMVARPWLEFVHPDDLSLTLTKTERFSSDKICRFENRYQHKDGSYRWLFWKVQPSPDRQIFYNIAIDITERVSTEADRSRIADQLKAREQQLQAIINNSKAAIFMKDLQGRYLLMNRECERLFNVTNDGVQGKTDYDLFPPEIADALQKRDQQVLAAGTALTLEEAIPLDDGIHTYVAIKFPIFDNSGVPYAVCGISTDITDRVQLEGDRRQAQAALSESEERWRTLADHMSQFAWMADANGWIFWYNRRWFDYTGTTLEQMQGWGWRDVHHPDHVDRVVEHINHCFETGEPWEDTFPLRSKTGEYRWFLSRATPIRDGQGQVLRWFGTNTDITDLRRAEEELRQKNAILDVINESAPTPIFVKDRQGRIIYANPATCKVLGKSAEEVMGYYDCDLYVSPEGADRVMENDRRIMESGQMEVVEESPDGVRTFLGMKVPYRNETGEVIGLIGISNDITDRVQLERDRERILQQEQALRAAAENTNRIKDEFLAVLSHELRTPMNPILGWAKLLRGGKLDSAKTALATETIERNAQLQVQLIDDLLDISRILQGKLHLSATPVNLSVVIRAAIETMRLAAEAKAIVIQPLFSSEDLVSKGDAGRLQQVIWNLLSNAVKFTPANGHIEVELSQVGTNAHIQVKDNGKGIKLEFLPYVFEHFRQEDGATTRKFGGLGLGLAIARQVVELHGGEIWVESPGEDQGATFMVQLPLISSYAQPLAPKSSSPNLQDLGGLRILVIDDEPDSQDFVAFVLEEAGAIVSRAASASEALRQVEQTAFDLIISDVGMPEMDGYQLMQQIRSTQSTVPAIALTAFAGESDRQEALQAGFQRHLSKPVDLEELMRAIAALGQGS